MDSVSQFEKLRAEMRPVTVAVALPVVSVIAVVSECSQITFGKPNPVLVSLAFVAVPVISVSGPYVASGGHVAGVPVGVSEQSTVAEAELAPTNAMSAVAATAARPSILMYLTDILL